MGSLGLVGCMGIKVPCDNMGAIRGWVSEHRRYCLDICCCIFIIIPSARGLVYCRKVHWLRPVVVLEFPGGSGDARVMPFADQGSGYLGRRREKKGNTPAARLRQGGVLGRVVIVYVGLRPQRFVDERAIRVDVPMGFSDDADVNGLVVEGFGARVPFGGAEARHIPISYAQVSMPWWY